MTPFTYDWWNDAIGRLFITVLGGLIAAGVGYGFAVLTDRRKSKQEFAASFGLIRERVELSENPTEVRAQTMESLIGPYHQFRWRLSRRRRPALEQTWKKYRDMTEQQLAPKAFDFGQEHRVLVQPQDEYEAPRRLILARLDDLLEFTK